MADGGELGGEYCGQMTRSKIGTGKLNGLAEGKIARMARAGMKTGSAGTAPMGSD